MKKIALAICLGILIVAGCTHLSKEGDFFRVGSAAFVLERMANGTVKLTVAKDEAMAE